MGREQFFKGRKSQVRREGGTSACRAGILLVLVLSCVAIPAARAQDGEVVLRNIRIDQRLDEQVPLDLVFRDEAGNELPLGTYFGSRPVVLALVYYECPMLCTLVLNGLTRALNALTFDVGDEFEVVTVSFDPTETAALAAGKKENYLRSYGRPGAEAGWHFLTGEQSSIERLTEAVGFHYQYDPSKKQYAHGAAIMVLTPQGRVARYFYGVEYAPRDLRFALIEAAQERIGTPVDQLLLYCYEYDPKRGRYSAVVMNILRLGGVLTVLGLGGFMIAMRVRESRAAAPPPKT